MAVATNDMNATDREGPRDDPWRGRVPAVAEEASQARESDVPATPMSAGQILRGGLLRLRAVLLGEIVADDGRHDTLIQVRVRITRVMVGLRLAMMVFPIGELWVRWHAYAHPFVMAAAVALLVVQSWVVVVVVRRRRWIANARVVWLDLAFCVVVSAIAVGGAGEFGRHHIGEYLPYLLVVPGFAGVALPWSKQGLAITLISALTWALMPLGRGYIVLGDVAGFLLWYVTGAVITANLVNLASALDKATSARVKDREWSARRWTHDIVGLLQRIGGGDVTREDQLAATRIASEVRLYELADARMITRQSESDHSCRGKITELGRLAESRGLPLRVTPAVVAEPADPAVAQAVFALLELLVANVATHAHASEARLTIRSSEHELVATLADNGKGFDPEKTHWSQVTREARSALDRLGGVSTVSSGGLGTEWKIRWPHVR